MSTSTRHFTGNRLLDSFPADELESLRPQLEAVNLTYALPLIAPHEPISHVWFPVNALASLVTLFEDGSTVEAGSVGREGMVGVPVVLGAESTPMQTVVQIPGSGYRLPAQAMRDLFARSPEVRLLLNRYVHALFVVASQSAACNRKHDIEARLARWLLMSSDGIGSESINLTQEFLATMLGVRRPGVTEAAVKLQNGGMISYSRGVVRLIDRALLEGRACECYQGVKSEFERLFG